MAEWKKGTVLSALGPQKIAVGQRWTFNLGSLHLDVVAITPEGEVALRPVDRAFADSLFPEEEVIFKGKPTKTRPACPFQWVTPERAKGLYREGDLLAHEAWSVWQHLTLHASWA